jgi:hypothetical protein
MVEVSAHLVDEVLPRVQHRPWALSMPKRVRWHLGHKPEVISGLLTVFLRAVETTIRQRSPGGPPDARFGAVAFVHRFGSTLNSHVHFHVLATDGVFSAGDDDEAVFHPALDLLNNLAQLFWPSSRPRFCRGRVACSPQTPRSHRSICRRCRSR